MSFSMYRRSITSRLSLLAPRFQPSFSHIIVRDDEINRHQVTDDFQAQTSPSLGQRGYNDYKLFGIRGPFVHKKYFASPLNASLHGSSFCRYYSNIPAEGSENIMYMNDVTEILADTSAELVATQTPLVNEVAIAAADSAYPVAALQYLIDGIHSFTGLNWWASIIIATVFIRTATIPLLINTLKATTKLSQLRPQMEEIREQMLNSLDPKSVADSQNRMKALMKEHNVSPFSPLKGLFIQGPIFVSFFFAISNMIEKVPSFKTGGALWFTDLTTVDSLYIFPVMTALSFLLTVELNAQEGMEGNPVAGTMKKFLRLLAVLTVPFTMGFPKGIFCYWFTSNVFSLFYGLIIKRPPVKRFLGLPEIVVPPPSDIPSTPFFGGPNSVMGKLREVLEQGRSNSQPTIEASADQKPKFSENKNSSSAVISQRIQTLEKSVKRRKKSKK